MIVCNMIWSILLCHIWKKKQFLGASLDPCFYCKKLFMLFIDIKLVKKSTQCAEFFIGIWETVSLESSEWMEPDFHVCVIKKSCREIQWTWIQRTQEGERVERRLEKVRRKSSRTFLVTKAEQKLAELR